MRQGQKRLQAKKSALTIFFLLLFILGFGQKTPSVFKWFGGSRDFDSFKLTKPLRFYEILCSKTGEHKFTSSFGLLRDKGMEIEIILYSLPGERNNKNFPPNYSGEDSVRSICEGPDKKVYFISNRNRIFWQPSDDGGYGFGPFNFPSSNNQNLVISKIWIDPESNIYLGANDNFYFIKRGAVMSAYDGKLDSVGNFIVTKGEKKVKQVILGSKISVYSFAEDQLDKNRIWIGTNNGIFSYNKISEECKIALRVDPQKIKLTITDMECDSLGNIWFSTLENGMGFFETHTRAVKYFNGKKKYSIKTFCKKSSNEFFVAIMDSLPAIFNISDGHYSFLQDSIFHKTADSTNDIKLDGFGNLFVVKGGGLFYTDFYKKDKPYGSPVLENEAYAPFISEITVMGATIYSGRQSKTIKKYSIKSYSKFHYH